MLDTAPTPRRLKRLNPRQQKKLHVGEFRELAFAVHATFKAPLDDAAQGAFLDAVYDATVDRGLMVASFGGVCPVEKIDGYVCSLERGSPTEDDRQWLVGWLQARTEVQSAQADDFVDAWYAS